MAFDKVIDSALLDAGMTATANAIRKKAGRTTPIAWDSANGFKAAVEGIDTEGGVELPELGDTAAKPTDMAADKVLYDDSGNPVTGTLSVIGQDYYFNVTDDVTCNPRSGDTSLSAMGVYKKSDIGTDQGSLIIKPGAIAVLYNIPITNLGDAKPEDVASGKTFTSKNGSLLTGTHECETGVTLPALTNPGTADDLASGRELIDSDGNVVTGTLNEIGEGAILGATRNKRMTTMSDSSIAVRAETTGEGIVRPGATLAINMPAAEFGDAAASDVAKGKTFTSSAGLLVEGTLETGSGGVHMSVDGETLVITGAVTIENETLIL